MERKFLSGAIPSAYDERDYQITDIIPCAGGLVTDKTYYNPLGWIVDIFDQAESNMCVACSLCVTRWMTEYNQSANDKQFSPAYIYFNRDSESDYCGEGMQPREALKHLTSDGVCFWDSYPGFFMYEDQDKHMETINTYKDEAKPYRISSYYAVNGSNQIKNTIKDLGAVSIMVPVYDCLYTVGSDGVVNYDSSARNTVYGYHQMTLFGWDENGWIGINSWGSEWGKTGRFYLPYDYPIQEAWAIVDEITEAERFDRSKRYDDITDHWNEDVIRRAINSGVMVGDEDDGVPRFRPDRALTRCEFVTVLDRLGLLDKE